jgi:hypothetical protein
MSHTAAPSIAGNAAPPAPPRHSANAPAYPTDEQILGITDDAATTNGADDARALSGADDFMSSPEAPASGRTGFPRTGTAPRQEPGGSERNLTPQQTNENAAANANGASAELPEWLARASAAAPESAPQLASLWQRANALDTFDRAYYGTDASAQQALVAQLYADDPAALRAMVAAAQQIMDGRGNSNRANDFHSDRATNNDDVILSGGRRGRSEAVPAGRQGSVSPATNQSNVAQSGDAADGFFVAKTAPQDDNRSGRATNANRTNAAASQANNFDPAAYAQFEQSTNDAVVADVNRAIDRALDRALPDNIADGARRRIAGDTLAEVHTALRGDRDLAAQVAQMLRGDTTSQSASAQSARFDSATRDAVARLIATRARGVVPEAARRVIGEWTGSVLASYRDRAAKTQASSARVDVTGGALPAPVPRRAVAPSEINYRATSDEDILSW